MGGVRQTTNVDMAGNSHKVPAVSGSSNRNDGGGGNGLGGYGYGSASYGSDASSEQIRSHPEDGLTPRNDGTLLYPTDKEVQQAANYGPITQFQMESALGKRDYAQQMFDISDQAADYMRDAAIERSKMGLDWQTQHQNMRAALNAIKSGLSAGMSGSMAKNMMQAYRLADDQMDVTALNALRTAVKEANIQNAETKNANVNARNELDIDVWAALRAGLADYAAGLSNINPSFASGIYGSHANSSTNEDTPEEDRPSMFLYEGKEGSNKPWDLYKTGERLAEGNNQDDVYRFLPVIDRQGHTLVAPPWWSDFTPEMYQAIRPETPGFYRNNDETATIAEQDKSDRMDNGSSASMYRDLAPYIAGYDNRSKR